MPSDKPTPGLLARPLTAAEAALLHEELKTTPNILGYTRRELAGFRDVLVAVVAGRLAGVAISKDLRGGWTEIAVVYVLPEFRGNGLGAALFDAAWRRAAGRGRHLIVLSRSPEVLRLMERHGMTVHRSMMKAPLAFHLHMNRHMMSGWRIREAFRKTPMMKGLPGLAVGVWRNGHAADHGRIQSGAGPTDLD